MQAQYLEWKPSRMALQSNGWKPLAGITLSWLWIDGTLHTPTHTHFQMYPIPWLWASSGSKQNQSSWDGPRNRFSSLWLSMWELSLKTATLFSQLMTDKKVQNYSFPLWTYSWSCSFGLSVVAKRSTLSAQTDWDSPGRDLSFTYYLVLSTNWKCQVLNQINLHAKQMLYHCGVDRMTYIWFPFPVHLYFKCFM